MIFVTAILYAVSSSVLLAIVLGLAKGSLSSGIASISLAAGALVAAFSFWRDRLNSPERRKLNVWEWSVIVLFALFALRAFLWLVFIDGNEIKVLSPNNLGDLSLHLTYIHQLASGAPFWPENPIVTSTVAGKDLPLTYPLGVDLFNSLLVLVGMDSLSSLIWVGLIGCGLTGVALWRWGGAFVLAGFLCSGGLAGFEFFRTWEVLDYQSDLAWKSLPLALLVTQRGLLFALPAGLLLLSSWRTRFFDADRERKWMLPYWGELLLYASMPVFHLHTFLFLSVVLLAWFIVREESRTALAKFVGLAFLPASALVFLVTGFLKGPSVLGVHLGWMQNDPEFLTKCLEHFGTNSPWFTAPYFWLLNFGILPFLLVLLLVQITRSPVQQWKQAIGSAALAVVAVLCTQVDSSPFEQWKHAIAFSALAFFAVLLLRLASNPVKSWERAIVFPALIVFALCCVIRFAPWEWDNTKLMFWAYLAVLPVLWSEIFLRWPVWLRAAVCFALFWSGFISLLGGIDESHRGYTIATRSEIDQLAPALRQVPLNGRFVAHPNYNHPLLLLGRPLVLGYTGHVWSHGYEWREQEVRVQAVLKGVDGWRDFALESGARYLFWGNQEREAYPDSPQPWRETVKLVTRGDWGEIYDLLSAKVAEPSAGISESATVHSSASTSIPE